MMKPLYITHWVSVNNAAAWADGEVRYRFPQGNEAVEKLHSLYKELEPGYPKFFKMDVQSKLGWLTAELLGPQGSLRGDLPPDQVALVLSNQSASLDTDTQYEASLHDEKEFLPSPAVFVYTLANIVAGEICIRHGIKGENNFLVSEEFDAQSLCRYVNLLFEEERCGRCLVGWVEAYKGSMKSILLEVVQDRPSGKEVLVWSENELNQLYKITEQV